MRSGCGWHGSVDACWHLAPLTHIRFQCPPINLISTSDFTKTSYRQEFKKLNVQILDGDQAIASSDGDDPHALQLQPNWDFMAWYLSPHDLVFMHFNDGGMFPRCLQTRELPRQAQDSD